MAADQHLLGPFVRRFLLEDVLADRNLSLNTQRSYRDAIRLLFGYLADHHATDPAHVNVEQVTADVVRAFLVYLEDHRSNSVATRNQRLTALHSLFRFISRQVPELVEHAAQVQAIPVRRTVTPTMSYLEKHEIDALLAVPDRRRAQGRRDYALLLFLYNTGARASEAAAVTFADITLDTAPSVRLLGKGRKTRLCPLWPHTVDVLRKLLGDRVGIAQVDPVFLNVRGQRITRYGVRALVIRAADKAAVTVPSLQKKHVSPHTIRHTTAVHLLRAGVDINTIRAWLGHVSLETTNRYAQIDLEMKAAALETCSVREGESVVSAVPAWREDCELLAFLTTI
jgi:site-specific recombinase XerD